MRKFIQNVAGLMAVFCVVGVANAASPSKMSVAEIVVTSEAGDTTTIRAVEGRDLVAKNPDTGVSYRIVPQSIGNDRFLLKVYAGESKEQSRVLDTIELSLDGQVRSSTAMPFAFTLKSISQESQAPTAPSAKSSSEPAPSHHLGCCAYCGGYYFCCAPAHGYCCSVSTSCGTGCSACVP